MARKTRSEVERVRRLLDALGSARESAAAHGWPTGLLDERIAELELVLADLADG